MGKRFSLKKVVGGSCYATMLFISIWLTIKSPEYLGSAASVLTPLGLSGALALGFKSAAAYFGHKLEKETK